MKNLRDPASKLNYGGIMRTPYVDRHDILNEISEINRFIDFV